jgi:MOSC domain-containing protein YiiM
MWREPCNTSNPTVVQINISQGGVPKRAVPSSEVSRDGIVGDRWRHPQIHGGPYKAILLVTAEGIEELAAQGFPVYPGALGENLTTHGLDRRSLRLGQRYRIGEVVIELSEIRIPCGTLSVYGKGIRAAMYDGKTQAGDPASLRWGLSGFYASVVRAGVIRAGDGISRVDESFKHLDRVAR